MRDSYRQLGRKLTRRDLLKLGAATIGIAAISACGQAEPTPAPAPTQAPEAAKPEATATPAPSPTEERASGGTLIVLVQNDWVSLDPIFNTAEPNGTNMIYGEWVRWVKDPATGHFGPQPDMVAEWDIRPEEIVLKLQKGVEFHDGTPWDAKAAKWNLDRFIFHPASAMKAYLAAVDMSGEDEAEVEKIKETADGPFEYSSKAVEIVDDYTVKMRLKTPMANILPILSNAMQWNNPICPTAYNKLGKQEYSRNPVGAGPFRFVEWRSGSHVILERNDKYWRKSADGRQLPFIDRIEYRLNRDDSVRLLELKSGKADFMELVQGKDIAGVKDDPNLTFMESESSGNNYRMIFDATNATSPFRNKKLRQAIAYALDREAMATTLGFGSGYGRRYLLPKGSFAYDETVPYYWFDKAKAEQLVKEALAEDASLAGAGGKINVTLSVIDRAVDKMQSEMIKQMADSIGFNVTIEIMERAAWTAKLVKIPGQPGGEFHFATMRNPVTPADPDEQWRTFFHSQGGFNVAHIDDPSWDKLIDAGRSALDIEERKQIYRQLEEKAFDECWYVWLWQQNWNWLMSKRLKGFQEAVTNRWLFTECWLEG